MTEEFVNIDKVSDKLQKVYQIQVSDDGQKVSPIYIGSYDEIPLVSHTTILYDQSKDLVLTNEKISKSKPSDIYRIHIVTYLLPEESIKNKLYNIVGAIIQKNKQKDSTHSLDLRYDVDKKHFEYVFTDHSDPSKTKVVEILKSFPGSDDVLEDLISRIFQDPIKSIILS